MQPYMEISGVRKTFGSFVALDDISLQIMPGEFVCFLGPSGCGKTTLLRLIAGLETQDAGRITQGGKDISRLPPQARDFGIVFQSYALFPNLSAADNVAYGLRNRRRPRGEVRARVTELLERVGLSEAGKKFPAQLSGGQQQRVALARALALAPGLLLLDEPLSALDAKVRLSLRSELKNLQRDLGVTTIMVTHDQEEALTMADRIVVMNHGNVQQVGTPQEIYRHPVNRFVATFVGSMNLIDAQVSEAGRVRIGDVTLTLPHTDGHSGAVTVAIRPEDIHVEGPGGAANRPNALPATLSHVEFMGLHARLHAQTALHERVLIDVPAQQNRTLNPEVGMPLTLTLPPEHLRIYG